MNNSKVVGERYENGVRNPNKIFNVKVKGKRSMGRSRSRWEQQVMKDVSRRG
jgi:hypothetical protein